MKYLTLEEIEKTLKINVGGDYNAMIAVAALFKKLYRFHPRIGLSGVQAEFADELLGKLPDKLVKK